MKKVLVIGSGLAGLACAIEAASRGISVLMVSPYQSERSQSVMAAGGINAVVDAKGDSVALHAEDTYKGGACIEDRKSIEAMCQAGPEIIKWLDEMGMAFNQDENGNIMPRAFGGQSRKRTCFSGAATGKVLISSLVFKCREYESKGLIKRLQHTHFYSTLLAEGRAYGALLLDEIRNTLYPEYADHLVMAVGGANQIFGKTTGSLLCDGYAVGKLFEQGVQLRNLEFIQYHPTTIETAHKRMLITEAARGEGGRLYYLEDGKRVYFMEDKYGEKGNLMPRDVVAKGIYDAPSQVYLDVSFLDQKFIMNRLAEVYEICKRYTNLDITREAIPVYPSVHFFMGGIDVDNHHCSNIKELYAIGECASKYHGANRLGGNSLLSAIYSGRLCAEYIAGREDMNLSMVDFTDYILYERKKIMKALYTKSKYPCVYIEGELAQIMQNKLGITREEQGLLEGIDEIDFYIKTCEKLSFDHDISLYRNLRIKNMLLLSKAILLSAIARKETRGAHIREDFPEQNPDFACASIARYQDGEIKISFRKENTQGGSAL